MCVVTFVSNVNILLFLRLVWNIYEVSVGGYWCISFVQKNWRGFTIQISICFPFYIRNEGVVVLSHFNLLNRYLFSWIRQQTEFFI